MEATHTLKIIADSGSTKTDWYLGATATDGRHLASPGLNPFFATSDEIFHTVDATFPSALLPHPELVAEVHFYGAGCTPEMIPLMEQALRRKFTQASLHVESDLLGAARALCGHGEGIACILGTGSNSCQYDGRQIVDQVSPLGFILGDEGSGAVLGRKLVGDILKRQVPAEVVKDFEDAYGLSRADIIYKVYKQPFPNRFLAGFAPFLSQHRRVPEVHRLLVDAFREFFRRNVRHYEFRRLPVHAVGSIAYHFAEEIKQAAEAEQIRWGKTLQAPLGGLIDYHFSGTDA
jgi:N-acetylglucosamine kinase-like BadF-type ATPase